MLKLLTAFIFLLAAVAAHAQVEVSDAWARATGQGQKTTGVFMNLTAKKATRLVGVKTDLTSTAEVHEMKMEKDVMKMAAVPSLNVPAGGAVELKPGGYHVMLMDLKAPLADKATVPITLTFENAKGVKSQVELQVPVRAMNAKMDHKH